MVREFFKLFVMFSRLCSLTYTTERTVYTAFARASRSHGRAAVERRARWHTVAGSRWRGVDIRIGFGLGTGGQALVFDVQLPSEDCDQRDSWVRYTTLTHRRMFEWRP